MTSLHRKLLPTTVVGSYSIPEWLERAKTDYFQRRISSEYLNQIHDVVIKSAIKDQELAGIDIVSDGELRRDNDVDYFLARIPGVNIPQRAKTDYFDYYDAEVTRPLPELPEEPGPHDGADEGPEQHGAGVLLLHPALGAFPEHPPRAQQVPERDPHAAEDARVPPGRGRATRPGAAKGCAISAPPRAQPRRRRARLPSRRTIPLRR